MTKEVIAGSAAAKRLPQNYVEAALAFEQSKNDQLKFSRKVAW